MSQNSMRAASCAILAALLAGCGGASTTSPSSTPPPVTTASALRSSASAFASASPGPAKRLQASGIESLALRAMPHARATTFPDVIVVGDVDGQQRTDVTGWASQAVHDVDKLTGRQSAGTLLVLAPRSETEFARIYGSSNITDIQADTVFPRTKKSYIVFNAGRSIDVVTGPSATSSMPQVRSEQVSRKVLTHEVFHALTLTYAARRRLPLWLTEGYAEWAGQKFSGLHLKPKGAVASLPSNSDMTGKDAVNAYQVATSFVRYLVKTDGQHKAIAFYRKAVAHPRGPLGPLAKQVLGRSLSSLIDGWQRDERSAH